MMIALTCWGCGWQGQVPDHFAGLNVRCKRCRSETVVPKAHAEEVYEHDSLTEIDPVLLSARIEETILTSVCNEPLSTSWPYL
jgi:hypothetical protein